MLQGVVSNPSWLTVESLRSVPGDAPVPQPFVAIAGMVAFVAHDLRQLLTTILANAEFLTYPETSEAQKMDLCQEIGWDVDRINELISSLLECAEGRDKLRPAWHNIVHAVERAMRMTGVRQKFRGISITHHHIGGAVGWFDAGRLERAVGNLILNACEAVDCITGKIVITTSGNVDTLQIGIRDNGPGIPAAIRDSVFQPFVTCGKAGGNGLGLAIAKKIVEDHGGTIHLEQRCETGTCFQITIPFG